mmetsp:Transcript_12165/g.19577  ORF Transcript_12165/g.19577 Transcript_12165/m.19577 type:complete len:103 (-) Transcript_12165:669-977(-)
MSCVYFSNGNNTRVHISLESVSSFKLFSPATVKNEAKHRQTMARGKRRSSAPQLCCYHLQMKSVQEEHHFPPIECLVLPFDEAQKMEMGSLVIVIPLTDLDY